MDKGRTIGIILGFLISIPCYLWLLIRTFKVGRKVFSLKSRTSPPACLKDSRFGVHKFVKVNGIKIHYVEEGDRDKPMMLFVHGFPEFWYSWRHQMKYFAKEGYYVVALDLPGYGDSEKPDNLDQYHVKDLADVVKGLVETLEVSRFTLVGHDWGGAICWTFAALYPNLLDNLIICNCPNMVAIREAGIEQKLKSWYFIFFQVPWLPELFAMAEDMKTLEDMLKDGGMDVGSEEIEAYKYTYRDFNQWNSAINIYRASFTAKTRNFWEDSQIKQKICNIQVRTLQIFGTGDKYLSEIGALNSNKYVADHQLELLNGVSHWVQQHDPETVNKLMMDFLNGK